MSRCRLRHAQDLDADALPRPLDVAEVRWALGDLTMITQNEVDRERYESRLKMQRDVYTALAEAEEKGIEKGRQEGRAKGQIARIVSFQRLLCRNIMTLDQLHSLSLADLETVAARLEAELASNLAGGT